MRVPALLSLLAVAVTASCYAFEDTKTPLGFCVAQAKLSCQAQFRCCTAPEREAQFPAFLDVGEPYSTEGECVDELIKACERFALVTDDAIANERVEFDPGAAADCVAAAKEAVTDCDPEGIFVPDEACAEVTTGQVDNGDPCVDTLECAEEAAVCVVETTDPAEPNLLIVTIEGRCEGPGDLGDECDFDADCLPPLVCGDEETCEELPGLGEVCDQFDVPACQPDLVCRDDDFDGVTECEELGDVDDTCFNDAECKDALFCDATFGTCELDLDIDDACSRDAQCESLVALCDFDTLTCQPVPDPIELETEFDLCDGL